MNEYKNMTIEQLEARFAELDATLTPADTEEYYEQFNEFIMIGTELVFRRIEESRKKN